MAQRLCHRSPRLGQPARGRRGSILVLVIVSTAVLIFVLMYYANSMTMEYRGTDNAIATYQAGQAADGARRYIIARLRQQIQQDPGRLPATSTYVRENVGVGDSSAFWIIGRDYNQTSSGGTSVNTTNFLSSSGSNEQPVYGLVAENSKLNLNTATVEQLEMLPDMTEELANAIIDWRTYSETSTENQTLGGGLTGTDNLINGTQDVAEAQYYLTHEPPFNNKSGPFETIDELRMIYAGIDPNLYVDGGTGDYDLLGGEDANRNGMLDLNENDGQMSPPRDNGDSHLDFGLLEYVTVCTREINNKQIDGTDRINITTSTAATQLQTLLESTFDSSTASSVVSALQNYLPTDSQNGQGQSQQSQLTSLLQTYNIVKDVLSVDQFAQIEDALTVSGDAFVKGRINVNTAPEAVLKCVPGIDETTAPELINYRQGRTAQDLRSVGWVAESGILTDDAITSAGPYLTTRTYQFSADVVAVGHKGRGIHRDLYIIDTADGEEPRIIYRRDLSRLGWPLGDAIREQIRNQTQEGNK